MGNKASSLEKIRDDILGGKMSINNIRGDETMQSIDIVIDVAERLLETTEKDLSSKEKKLFCSIANSLGNEVGVPDQQVFVSVIKACRMKILIALARFLSVPFIAKQELDAICLIGINKCLNIDDVEIQSMAIFSIQCGLKSLDDDIQKVFSIEKCNYLLNMGDIIINTGSNSAANSAVAGGFYPFLMVTDHLLWILQRTSDRSFESLAQNSSSLRLKVIRVLDDCVKSLFELVRSDVGPVRHAAVLLLINLLWGLDDKYLCSAVQEMARRNGLCLWNLLILTKGLLEQHPNFHTPQAQVQQANAFAVEGGTAQRTSSLTIDTSASLEHTTAQPQQDLRPPCLEEEGTGPLLIERSTGEQRLDALKTLIAMTCVGCPPNETVFFRVFPAGFRDFLHSKAKMTRYLSTASSTPTMVRRSSSRLSPAATTSAPPSSETEPSTTSRRASSISMAGSETSSRPSPTFSQSGAVGSGPPSAALGAQEGLSMLSSLQLLVQPFAVKMGAPAAGCSWHALLDALNRRHRTPLLVWNPLSSLPRALEALEAACRDLDRQRARQKDFAWDASVLDVVYPEYSSPEYLFVHRLFLVPLLDELRRPRPPGTRREGLRKYLPDPAAVVWWVIDRAAAELDAGNTIELLVCLKVIYHILNRYWKETGVGMPAQSICIFLRKSLQRLLEWESKATPVRGRGGEDEGEGGTPVATSNSLGDAGKLFGWAWLSLHIIRLRILGGPQGLAPRPVVTNKMRPDNTVSQTVSNVAASEFANLGSVSVTGGLTARQDLANFTASGAFANALHLLTSQALIERVAAQVKLAAPICASGTGGVTPDDFGGSAGSLMRKPSFLGFETMSVTSFDEDDEEFDDDGEGSDVSGPGLGDGKGDPLMGLEGAAFEQVLESGLLRTADAEAFLMEGTEVLRCFAFTSVECARRLTTSDGLDALARALWLSSTHGPASPTGFPAVTEAIVRVALRLIEVAHPRDVIMAVSGTPLLAVVVAASMRANGTGIMTPSMSRLLCSLVRLSIPIATASGDSGDMKSEGAEAVVGSSSLASSSSTVASSASTGTGATTRASELSSDFASRGLPANANANGSDSFATTITSTTASAVNWIGAVDIGSAEIPCVTSLLSSPAAQLLPVQILRLCLGLADASLFVSVFNADMVTPEIIWDESLRIACLGHVHSLLNHWLSSWETVNKVEGQRQWEEKWKKQLPQPIVSGAWCWPAQWLDGVAATWTSAFSSLQSEPQTCGTFLRIFFTRALPEACLVPVDVVDLSDSLLRVVEATLGWEGTGGCGGEAHGMESSSLARLSLPQRVAAAALCLARVLQYWQVPVSHWRSRIRPILKNSAKDLIKRIGLDDESVTSSELGAQAAVAETIIVEAGTTNGAVAAGADEDGTKDAAGGEGVSVADAASSEAAPAEGEGEGEGLPVDSPTDDPETAAASSVNAEPSLESPAVDGSEMPTVDTEPEAESEAEPEPEGGYTSSGDCDGAFTLALSALVVAMLRSLKASFSDTAPNEAIAGRLLDKSLGTVTVVDDRIIDFLDLAMPTLSTAIAHCSKHIYFVPIAKDGPAGDVVVLTSPAAHPRPSVALLTLATSIVAAVSIHIAERAQTERDRNRINPGERGRMSTKGGPSPEVKPASPLLHRLRSLLGPEAQLLSHLVWCARAEVASVAPQATLSALAALHLLIGAYQKLPNDDISTGKGVCEDIIRSLCTQGLPTILLETILRLTGDVPRGGDDESMAPSIDEGEPSSPTNCGDRFGFHPLYSVARFVQLHAVGAAGGGSVGDGAAVSRREGPPSGYGEARPLVDTCFDLLDEQEGELKAWLQSVDTSGEAEAMPIASVAGEAADTEQGYPSKVFPSSEDEGDGEVEGNGGTTLGTTRTPLFAARVVCECAELLRLLLLVCGPGAAATDEAQDVALLKTSSYTPALGPLLDYLLTPSLVFLLVSNVELFIKILSANATERPQAIWNKEMRSILSDVVARENTRLAKHLTRKRGESADTGISDGIVVPSGPEGYRQLFPRLASECVVEGVFVRFLVVPEHKDDIGQRNLVRFVEALQTSIRTSRLILDRSNKLAPNVKNKLSAGNTNALMAHITAKEKALARLLEDHPELGYADLDISEEADFVL